jgi:hypothetical protein
MIVSSFSDELMDELTRRSGAGSREYWRHCIVTTEQAIEDIGKLCGTKGCLEIGQLPFMPSFGIVMVNPRSEEVGRAIVEVYHHDRSPLNATFSLDVKNDPYWFIEYQKQYEILWSKCNVKSI